MSNIVNSYIKKYSPSNLKYLLPSINGAYSVSRISIPRFSGMGMTTKSQPEMSEEKYKEAIIALAESDAARGVIAENPTYMKLKKSFISVVSPDRRGIITNSLQAITSTGSQSISFAEFKDHFGNVIAHYTPQNGWIDIATPIESIRESEFNAIYNEAWNAATQSRKLKVKSINMVV